MAEDALRHNPFQRPIPTTSQITHVLTSSDANQEIKPVLQGVVLSGKQSIANVSGTILKLGESKDGLHLISVSEDKAVVKSDGKRMTLKLGENND